MARLVAASRAAGVRDERVLAAIGGVDRTAFVPAGEEGGAGRDAPIRIPHGQVTTQPSLVARMVEALALDGSERVLEVGAGLGYQAAVLAALAREVWSVEWRGGPGPGGGGGAAGARGGGAPGGGRGGAGGGGGGGRGPAGGGG